MDDRSAQAPEIIDNLVIPELAQSLFSGMTCEAQAVFFGIPCRCPEKPPETPPWKFEIYVTVHASPRITAAVLL